MSNGHKKPNGIEETVNLWKNLNLMQINGKQSQYSFFGQAFISGFFWHPSFPALHFPDADPHFLGTSIQKVWVEALITQRLPRRSVRAEFPHTVPRFQLF
ncbi:hypothetical protein [Desulfobacter latus]|uniref:Uncharacterized protein n=1 Tax=Desulfobacter latus TaxID=2292 RepID=A0A850SWY7_9BACT|nr:hypothetical protein [Desulfobacter latus]NWH05659.1 hypothetical protein [Desulfobacter latus]